MASRKAPAQSTVTLEDQVRNMFPRLMIGDIQITSDRDPKYNCIAWAMGVTNKFWWPDADGYWPTGVERAVTVEAFTKAFATKGFVPCESAEQRAGKEVVALYTLNGRPTHAAFLHQDSVWASKLGRDHDVKHRSLDCIGGERERDYGSATHFFERDLPTVPRAVMPNTQYEYAQRYAMTNEAQGRLKPKPAAAAPAKGIKRRH